MNVGMLWFDNDPKTALSAKVERAAAYYRNKYGNSPTICFVHPSMLAVTSTMATGQNPPPVQTAAISNNLPVGEPSSLKAAGVEIRSTRSVLPNHFWIGVNGMNVP